MEGLKSLARNVEYCVLSNLDNTVDKEPPAPFGIIMACAEVRELLDHFPDSEVDEVFCAELKRRIDCNGERLAAVGRLLKINFLSPRSWPDAQAEKYARWRVMLCA